MNTDKTESIYAATKKAGEVMYTYSHLHNLPITVLRFLQFMVHMVDRTWQFINLLRAL